MIFLIFRIITKYLYRIRTLIYGTRAFKPYSFYRNHIMEIKRNSPRAWLLAARPKTLTAAAIPIIAAVALAAHDGVLHPAVSLLCLLFACGMQVAANFINDLYDFLRGTDREDRLGPERACQQGWISPRAMKWGIGITIALSCVAGLGVLALARLPYGGWELVALGAVCVVFAFLYTTRLSYSGWGDVLVIVFFGFVPVCGTYYVQCPALTWDVAITSLCCGLLIDTLLMVNNYRDREQDRLSGKRTLVVRLGEQFGHYAYLVLGIAATALALWFADSWDVALPLLYLALHIHTWQRMVSIGKGKKLNSILGETSRNMLFMGVMLAGTILLP